MRNEVPRGSAVADHGNGGGGIPKSTPKCRRSAMLSGAIRPTKKPDWDNIGKLVCDALNGVAYDDDKCVCEAVVRKFYGCEPRILVRLEDINA